jgi:hypothetical protein
MDPDIEADIIKDGMVIEHKRCVDIFFLVLYPERHSCDPEIDGCTYYHMDLSIHTGDQCLHKSYENLVNFASGDRYFDVCENTTRCIGTLGTVFNFNADPIFPRLSFKLRQRSKVVSRLSGFVPEYKLNIIFNKKY